jgi:hypothetical protein
MTLRKRYDPSEYPHYDNYDAIEVSKVAEIPCDYHGVMGVPITFMEKYCPEQFEILGMSARWDETEPMRQLKTSPTKRHEPIIAGTPKYRRIFVRLIRKS